MVSGPFQTAFSRTPRKVVTANSVSRTGDAYFDGIIVEFVNDKLTGGAVLFVNGQETRRAALLQISTSFHNFTR